MPLEADNVRKSRLLWIVVLGIVVVCLGCDNLMSGKKSEAILRVNRETFKGNAADFMLYKETHASLLKSTFVLNAAMRSLEGQQFKNLTPAALSGDLFVSLDESELITVALRQGARSPSDTERILSAVVEAYENEIVNKERIEKVQTLVKLRKRYQILFDTVKKKSDEIGQLAKDLGATGSADTAQSGRREIVIESIALLREKKLELQLQQVAEEFNAKSESTLDPATKKAGDEEKIRDESEELVTDIDTAGDEANKRHAGSPSFPESKERPTTAIGRQIEFLNSRIAEETTELGRFGMASGDLEARTDDLEALRRDMQTVRKEMQTLEIALDGPQSVTIIQMPGLPQ